MNTRMLLNMSLPALLLAGATVAVASARDAAADAREAAKVAARAGRALEKRDAADAVAHAERAVALSPRDAAHRALLGQAYLQAGRFASARATLEEAIELDPENGRAALSLTLARIATGDWAGARLALVRHAGKIPAGDAGLAVALAGDPAAAVGLLTQAARQPGATARTRQNLALALALAGQWQAARVVAAADLSPADLDARLAEWAVLAQPSSPSDQVAHLLGVTAVQDSGRPAALALNAPAAPVQQAAKAPAVEATPAPAPFKPEFAGIVFAPPKEVVQALPTPMIRPAPVFAKLALARAERPTPPAKPAPAFEPVKGDWYVQLGAFDSAAIARDAWGRAARRLAAFRDRTPTGMTYHDGARSFYRLSVGGFSNESARALCVRYRAKGGTCFVRLGEGDQVAQWLRKPKLEMAAR